MMPVKSPWTRRTEAMLFSRRLARKSSLEFGILVNQQLFMSNLEYLRA